MLSCDPLPPFVFSLAYGRFSDIQIFAPRLVAASAACIRLGPQQDSRNSTSKINRDIQKTQVDNNMTGSALFSTPKKQQQLDEHK